jgi:guanylate kinase
MSNRGTLYTISAPSGAGKTSLVNALLEHCDDICVSVSHTTRPKRPGERDGVNYHFVNKASFMAMVNERAFLEHAQVFNNHYGTDQNWVESVLTNGKDVVLEIDWQGATQIRQLLPDCVGIFILPPSLKTLEERLTGRGQDDPAVIRHRLAEAQEEMSHYAEADYLVINDNFDVALAELKSIVVSQRLKLTHQQQRNSNLLKDLLS